MLCYEENGMNFDIMTGKQQVVANIPFNISTDILKQLLPMGDLISQVVLLLQVCLPT